MGPSNPGVENGLTHTGTPPKVKPKSGSGKFVWVWARNACIACAVDPLVRAGENDPPECASATFGAAEGGAVHG